MLFYPVPVTPVTPALTHSHINTRLDCEYATDTRLVLVYGYHGIIGGTSRKIKYIADISAKEGVIGVFFKQK